MDPSLLKILFLSVVQGIAEFLPISSDGHLVLGGQLVGLTENQSTVTIVLHGGTLLSIIVVFWRRILQLLLSDRRVIMLMIIGTLPAAVFGLLMKAKLEWLLENPWWAAGGLLFTAAVLWTIQRAPQGDGEYQKLGWKQALWIGTCQATAILPGVSRSGTTIAAARYAGLKRDDAVNFSFLLAIPAICGALVLESIKLYKQPDLSIPWTHLAIGTVVSFLLGIVALRWLMRWSQHDRLHWFIYYLIPLSIVAFIWLAVR
jgi:undecaprenyl-diphosphatase